MSFKPINDRQIINNEALVNIGSPANDTLDDIFSRIDSALAGITSNSTYTAKQIALTSGSTSLAVTFPSQPDTSYTVLAMMGNTTDANPQFQQVELTAKSTSGVTISWNIPLDSNNYFINYIIPSKTSVFGESSISSSALNISVSPSILQSSSGYAALAQLQNIVDATPQFQPVILRTGTSDTDWIQYTPTFVGFGTPTSQMFYRIVGDTLFVAGDVVAGTTTSVTGSMSLPSGLTMDSSKISTNNQMIGQAARGTTATPATDFSVLSAPPDQSNVYFGVLSNNGSNPLLPITTWSGYLAPGDIFSLYFQIPIQNRSSSTDLNVSWNVATDTANYQAAYLIGAAQAPISNSSTSITVPLPINYGAINYAAVASVQNIVDINPQFQPMIISAQTNNSVTFSWNVARDSANYLLNYYVISLTP